MQSTLYNISQVLGITVIHSLWQGMLVYFVLRIVYAGYPLLPALRKYQLAIFAMACVTVLFVYTLATEIGTLNRASLSPGHLSPLLPLLNLPLNRHLKPTFYQQFSGYLPYVCALYLAGLAANLVKLCLEWSKIQRIKRTVLNAEQMQQFINSFSKKLEISKHIQIKFSDLIDVPCILGYIRPLILLPVSLSVHLSACEVEAILLHELAHIKRNDYLVNLLQQAISVILFFNPFSRLINRIINLERENSCDDLVISKTAKPLIYARALLKLEASRAHDLQLALAVTGSKFYLLKRIERIMKTQTQPGNMRNLFIAILLFAGALGCITWLNPGYAKTIKAKVVAAHGSATLNPDSTKYTGIDDTIKHKYNAKAAVKSKSYKKHISTKKHDTTTWFRGDDNDTLAGFYRSPEWKKQMEAIRKQSEEMRKKFNSPEWKNQMLAMQKQSDEMRKKFDSPEWKQQMEDMKKQGEEMRKKFDSPEWKQQMEDMKKQGEEMRKKFDSPEWKQQMEQIQKQGDQIKKQFNSPEWKKQVEQIQKQSDQMRKQFDSPEWKRQMEQLQKQGDQIRKQFDSPEWKRQMEQIQKQSDQLKKQFDSAEWKQQKAEWEKMKHQKWVLKDSTSSGPIYVPKKDTVRQ